ncbi:MAG: competence/damage-inducible protein A [Acidobacterium ailaaui]|jgi:nicotinamide-nucleotide amidase|nr:competence/damage-inducible protein A [Pseudacidobacterium ailaaui]MCL6464064.1 competence/damage-inducible protein A [Pseudacidobacterium ailaaui]MDI3253936.1 competence/damage-inducible protein A [Bacillota bacterium]
MKCEIIAIGSELLTPWRQDTNSLYLTERLNEIGVVVAFKTIVGDRRKDLAAAIRTALGRTDIVITMGGLGPTEDDLTREAWADVLGTKLKRDADIVGQLYARAAQRRWTLTENNLKQADMLEGAEVLENPHGTAPGQWLDTVFAGHRKLGMLLPGPPREIKPMFDQQCMPRLRAVLPVRHIATRTLKAAMIGESLCDSRIAPIYTQYPDVETTILAGAGDIQITLMCRHPRKEYAEARVHELASRIEDELDDFVYSSQGEGLEQIVLYYLEMRGATLSVAESCTGGMLAQRLTSVSGSSRSFLGGAVVYSNELKTEFAGVPEELIEMRGAVSREVAAALAEGIRRRCSSTYGVGITGIAGPTGGTEEKPVGLVYIALSDGVQTEVVEKNFAGDRERVRFYATQQALDMVRRRLM